MDVITEKPRPVVPHCGACCGASGPGQGAHAQYRPARSEAVTWPTGPGCGGRGCRRGLAGLRDRPLRAVRLACGDHAGRPPPTDATHGRIKQPGPTAGSNNTWNTSYTRNTSGPLPPPTDTAHRCHPRAHQAARPHRHAPPDTRHQTRARNTSGATTTDTTKRAGTSRFRPALDTQRLSALRARWHHATGAHRCTTAVRCQ